VFKLSNSTEALERRPILEYSLEFSNLLVSSRMSDFSKLMSGQGEEEKNENQNTSVLLKNR